MDMPVRVLSVFLLLFVLPSFSAEEKPYVPGALQPWSEWVLHGEEYRECPFFAGAKLDLQEHWVCAWPGRLELDLLASGGRFNQTWKVIEASAVPLPGDRQYWPQTVTANGRAMPVTGGTHPVLHLEAGTWNITGEFSWNTLPDELPVPHESGVIALAVNDQAVARPVMAERGVLLNESGAKSEQEQDELFVEVYRKITDSVPQMITTVIDVAVAGQAREEQIGQVIPAGFVPVHIRSELPGRLDAQGRLIAQVRPGEYQFTFEARAEKPVTEIAVPEALKGADSEVWVYEPDYRYRVSSLEGLPQIDPGTTTLPNGWHKLPAYVATPETTAMISERPRTEAEYNRVSLHRQAWLDFDRAGFTVLDQLTGEQYRDWRFDMLPPYRLESAQAHDEPLMITRLDGTDTTGVEMRYPAINLKTSARLEPDAYRFPATGWSQTMSDVRMQLHLPPGSRLIAAFGADAVYGDWLNQWSLLDMFVVTILAALAWRLLAPLYGIALLAAALLLFQEFPAIFWLLFPAFAAIAIVRATGAGRIHSAGKYVRNTSLLLLLLVAVPILANQLRYALHPQLDGDFGVAYLDEVMTASEPAMDTHTQTAVRRQKATEEAAELERVQVTGSKLQTRDLFSRYESNAVIQAGTETPQWRWRSATLAWSAPVHPDDELRLVLVSGFGLAVLRVIAVALFALLCIGLLLRVFSGTWLNRPALAWLRLPAIVVAAGLSSFLQAPPVNAMEQPSAELLNTLRERLIAPPECLPHCVAVESADIRVRKNAIDIHLRVHTGANVAVALPGNRTRWEPETVTVNGVQRQWFVRDANGRLAIELAPGVHDVRLSGVPGSAATLEIPFPVRPGSVKATAEGWDLAGVQDGRLPSGSLELVRRREAGTSEDTRLQFDRVPPFIEISRNMRFDLDFSVYTAVSRLAPEIGALTLRVPLLAEEKVTAMESGGAEKMLVQESHVVVPFAIDSDAASWRSLLPRATELAFTASRATEHRERWTFTFGPAWHFSFDGMLPVKEDENTDANDYRTFEFWPQPGETLTVRLARPAPVEGRTLLVENVQFVERPGARESEGTLDFSIRATRGGQIALDLPEDILFNHFSVNGRAEPIQADSGHLIVPVGGGEHEVSIGWRRPNDMNTVFHSMPLSFGVPQIANVRVDVAPSRDRWILFVDGPQAGPAVLYWAELVVFALLAFVVSRLRLTPLRFHEWLLLGFGLSTWSWSVVVLVTIWLHAFRLRDAKLGETAPWLFNARQVLLAFLTIAALIALASAIPATLLGTPDMHIAGPQIGTSGLSWFVDSTTGALPVVTIVSVPLWAYKLVILAWALWLSISIPRWIRWAWSEYSKGGLWIGKVRPS